MAIATTLILDDSYDRLRALTGSLRKLGEIPVICETVEEAIAKLADKSASEKITSLFLDHDLGDGKSTGADFAKWLAAQDRSYGSITIHSLNPAGAVIMAELVKYKAHIVQVIPYTSLKETLEEMAEGYQRRFTHDDESC